ncbi:MAG: DEAD/DEAH box helicase, partial [Desulfosudaceae bacterium]
MPVKMSQQGDIREYIQSLVKSPRMAAEVVHHQTLRRRPARSCSASFAGGEMLEAILSGLGVEALYTHQAEGVEHVRAGRHVVVATPTASGKTFIYNLPVLEKIRKNPAARALYLFPLKALAQDQRKAFEKMAATAGMENTAPAIYDGDTSDGERKKIRQSPPAVLMTNPDMVHLSLLPYHESWQTFFENLEIVVIDEIHTYRGVMGSHMAQVFRRLRRICAHYGSRPVFVASSATIGNPGQLAGQLTGLRVRTIEKSGAPRGRRHVVLLNPGTGPVATAIKLLKSALHRELRTIVYTQSRKLTELISLWVEKSERFADRVSSYRAGLLPAERREVEARLSSGDLLAVISTSALELGIDIGDLDLCILVGYPGSIMATWQRGGRVGRAGQDSALLLVAGEDALDQYFMRHPQEFLARPPEAAVINPENRAILEKHLRCAAAELPLYEQETFLQPPAVRAAAAQLEAAGRLLRSGDGRRLFAAEKAPHRRVDLRGVGSPYTVVCAETGDYIGTLDGIRAFHDGHPGAIYIHLGRTYVVEKLDSETRTITAAPSRPRYYTKVRSDKNTEILEVFQRRQEAGLAICTGRLRVTEQITGYEKKRLYGRGARSIVPLDMPPLSFETEGVWFVIPEAVREEAEIQYRHFMGGIHAAEHALIGALPFFVLCDRNDLGGISIPFHPQAGGAAIFIYDALAGGIGLSRQAYERPLELLFFTEDLIRRCPCRQGCPSCVHSPKCGSGNRPIDKSAALFVLNRLLRPRQAAACSRPPEPAVIVKDEAAAAAEMQTDTEPPPLVHYGVFDVETQRSAREVGGWNRAERMGISCVVLYDSAEDRYYDYLEAEIPAFIAHLRRL